VLVGFVPPTFDKIPVGGESAAGAVTPPPPPPELAGPAEEGGIVAPMKLSTIRGSSEVGA